MVDFGQQFLPLELVLGRTPQTMRHRGIELVLQHLELRLLLVQQLRQLLVLGQQVRVLPQYDFDSLLQLAHLLALRLQNRVLLLQHVEVLAQQLLDFVGVLLQLRVEDIPPRTPVRCPVLSSHFIIKLIISLSNFYIFKVLFFINSDF